MNGNLVDSATLVARSAVETPGPSADQPSDALLPAAPTDSDRPENDADSVALSHRLLPAPLLPLALGLIAGIVVDYYLQVPMLLSVLAAAFGCAVAFVTRNRPLNEFPITKSLTSRYPTARKWAPLLLIAGGLGMLRHGVSDRTFSSDDVARFASDDAFITTLVGVVDTPPRVIEPRVDIPTAYERPARTRFVLQVEGIQSDAAQFKANGKVMVTIREPLATLREQDRIRITGWLYRIAGPQNPGAYDWARHHRRDGIFAGISTDHAAAVTVVETEKGSVIARMIAAARRRLSRYLTEAAFPEDEESAGIVSAMVLGRRSDVSRAMNESFVRTGNVHFLAASGMNVAWLALVGWVFAYLCGLNYRATAVLVAGLIIAFVLVAEPQPSILRAGVVGLLTCLTIYGRGFTSHVNSLAAAAILLLMIDPGDCFRPGFQLTFVATIGLLHFFPIVSNGISRFLQRSLRSPRIGELFRVNAHGFREQGSALASGISMAATSMPSTSRAAEGLYRAANLAALALALAVSEWIITTPLALYHFNNLTPWGALGTFLTAPFAMLCASIGFVTVLAGLILPTSGLLLGPLLMWATAVMIGVVEILARLPGTLLDGRSPPLVWVICAYLLMGLWAYGRPHWRERYRRAFRIALLLLIVVWRFWPLVRHWPDGNLRVWMLAVGDGTATVVELPNGKTLLYDFGTSSAFDASTVAADLFRVRGIRAIDAAFVSHPNFDHYCSIPAVARKFTIGRVIINDQFEPLAAENPAALGFLASMREMDVPVEIVDGPAQFDYCEGVTIKSIWPPPHSQGPAPTENDGSIVLRIEYQNRSILLTGDVAEWSLGALAQAGDPSRTVPLKADALALPHHGSVIANTRTFISAVDPAIAVRS
ncbi:MAG TPA: ComEC/Rec2 family competence protein, partial [Phycisphaerae bacterium]|nr:ComEC/Rec2 family competence protein [Phycisphaerae bacterium]